MTGRLKLFNGNIITPGKIIGNGSLLISDGIIAEVRAGDIDAPGAIAIDVGGKYISPGFIDLHVHGGGGSDFMDGSVEAFLTIAETHIKYGTTAMAPTTLASGTDDLLKALDDYELANKQNKKGPQFIGVHIEGPYFAMNQRGAQDPRYIRNPIPEEYQLVLSRSSSVVRWSAAPELPGALDFGRYVRSRGVLPAIAHTDAVYDEVMEAFEAGYTLATHFYSAMSGVTRRNAYRYAGVIESAYLIDEMDVEIIADGVHLPPPLLKLVYKIKGPDHTALITDAMRAAAMPPGDSILGSLKNGFKVIVEDGVAKLPDRSAFAGSVATADRLVRTMIKDAGAPLADAVKMMSSTPARIIGINDKKGSLTVGMDADIAVFNDDINVAMTIVKGDIRYRANP